MLKGTAQAGHRGGEGPVDVGDAPRPGIWTFVER
jgi:hypothetical protein